MIDKREYGSWTFGELLDALKEPHVSTGCLDTDSFAQKSEWLIADFDPELDRMLKVKGLRE